MRVQVAIDLALDRLFTYEVPEALKEKLAVGQLLSVPFGHREARGFAVAVSPASAGGGLTAQPPAKPLLTAQPPAKPLKIKPVTAIVDETPFFSATLLELVRRVAAYTASPVESVLKAALPAAVLKKNAHAKEQLFVEVAAPQDGAKTPAPSPAAPPLTKRQAWLIENIARLGGGWMTGLCRELKTTPASLRQLAVLGHLAIAPRARRRDPLAAHRILPTKPLALNDEQKTALDAIVASAEKKPHLLFGVTGSGKTEVYLQAIAHELEQGRGAIVMVPEIALTPQTVQRFASRFGDKVAVLHSALSDGERYDEWHRIRAGVARVVVGPRSAVWAPVRNLGLIVVDEEHEGSYKQDEMPRYNARDVAVLRGATEGAKVVLGSATPALETWHNVEKGKYRLLTLAHRAGHGSLPQVHLVSRGLEGAIFSRELLDAIAVRLERHEQTILFLNRRGYSRQVVCEVCENVISCPNCSSMDRAMPYTYHRADQCLRCHVCGGWIPIPPKCPVCGSPRLAYRGIGTQRAEAALLKCFKSARVLRMDADSTSRRHSHDEILGVFRRGEADILIGTQMIAKGLDFPNVTLVGVLNADSSLSMPDFRATERTYQLLSQVAGRAGRAELPGEVFIQTNDPENAVFRLAARGDYASFAASELKERASLFYPPFSHLAIVSFIGKSMGLVSSWAEMYSSSLKNYAASAARKGEKIVVSDALPSALEKADGLFRWQVVMRAASSAAIVRAWRWIVSVRKPPATLRISLDVDALNLV